MQQVETTYTMMTKGLSVQEISEKFIHQELQKIEAEPTYADLQDMCARIWADVVLIPSTRGGGAHGHLGAYMTPTRYLTLAATPWTDPNDPGIAPVYPVGASGPARTAIKDQWESDRAEFVTANNVQLVVKRMIKEAMPEECLEELNNRITGFHGTTGQQMIQHLMRRYGKISESDKARCKAEFASNYDPDRSIACYWKMMDDTTQLADDAGIPFSAAQILQQATFQMKKCGLYKDEMKEWKRKPVDEQTWANFKTHFSDAYFELKEDNDIGTKAAGFHTANLAETKQEHQALMADALNNMANAVTADTKAMAEQTGANKTLTETNASLVKQLKEAQTQLKEAQGLNKKLMALLEKNLGVKVEEDAENSNPNKRRRRNGKGNWRLPRGEELPPWDPHGYCWTHGFKVRVGHNSFACEEGCKNPKHQRMATRSNTMGGSQVGKDE